MTPQNISASKYKDILHQLKSLADPKAVAGMVRFGINPKNTYGVSIPKLRKLAKEIGINHALAKKLWLSRIHEVRILASMIDDFEKVTEKQMEDWVKDFDSWDVCDQVCLNLFAKTRHAYYKCIDWSLRKEEFVKRAGFALMACLAVGDKDAEDKQFEVFFPLIKREAQDERNFVKKAVNWALRQIGKRNLPLNTKAITVCEQLQKAEAKSAKWIATDAFKELTSRAVQKRLKK
ncbi:DNA alkylation repair protein [Patescibacteria group bacterium]|nr:DNA alkylation repair protein [Patescibacteria group bacterium]